MSDSHSKSAGSQGRWAGSLYGSAPYVRGRAVLRFGLMRDYVAELAVFAGVADGSKVLLVGPPEGLAPELAGTLAIRSLDYYVLLHLSRVVGNTAPEVLDRFDYEGVLDEVLGQGVLPPKDLHVEFLARPLVHSSSVFVATPLYVFRV
ncbi:DUF7019 family protein [Streptomyces rubiginosohelvolus]|uniref:DUF7019 family protein n=1 Tax=Streptomyces rubiginosohelvolus TaxID=67362 RepID=UPI0036B25D47